MKKFHLITFGCQMNYSDSERLSKILEDLGYTKTEEEKEADLIAVVACSVKQQAVDRIVGKLRNWQLIKEKRPLITLLSGCVLDQDKKKLKDSFDLFIDIKNLDNLAEDLKSLAPEEKLALPNFFDIKPSYFSKYRAYVPIMTGCNKFCTYCVVPYARGRETSRPAKEIIKEIKELLAKGYKEIILLGQNVNSYGLDRKDEIEFPELLQTIDNLGNNFWLKFLTSHPYDMSDKLIEVISKGKNINNYLHLPVQSGSDTVLARMNRHYTVKNYQQLIKKVKDKMPDITISTDIIVGFCQETDKEFEDTVKLVKDIKYNMIYVSQYSQRAGTAATKLYKDDIDKKIKKERWHIINTLTAENSLEFNKKLLNQTTQTLIDVVKKTKDGYNNIGKLSNYTAVHIYTKQPLKVGEFAKVKITEAKAWGLKAELYEA